MKKKIKNTHQHCRNGKIVENWTFNTLTLYGHSVPVNKKSGWHFKKQGGGGRSCIRSIKRASVFFFFLSLSFSNRGRGSGKGKWRRQVHPPRQANNSAVQKEFCRQRRFIFQCRGAATGVAGAVKVAPWGHQREHLVRHFPNYHPISLFFVAFHGYTIGPPTTSTVSLFKKKLSCTHFTVPKWLERCSYFPFFFFCSFSFPTLSYSLQQILVEKQDVRTSKTPCTGS